MYGFLVQYDQKPCLVFSGKTVGICKFNEALQLCFEKNRDLWKSTFILLGKLLTNDEENLESKCILWHEINPDCQQLCKSQVVRTNLNCGLQKLSLCVHPCPAQVLEDPRLRFDR